MSFFFVLNSLIVTRRDGAGPRPPRSASPNALLLQVHHGDRHTWYSRLPPSLLYSDSIWFAAMSSHRSHVVRRATLGSVVDPLHGLISLGLVDWDGRNQLADSAIDGMRLAASLAERLLTLHEGLALEVSTLARQAQTLASSLDLLVAAHTERLGRLEGRCFDQEQELGEMRVRMLELELAWERMAFQASSSGRSIAEGTNNDYYYDNWENFLAEFLKRYGLVNETQHWYQLMTNCEQESGADCKAYINEFERRRVEAKTTKENAFYFLKKGTSPKLRSCLLFQANPPDNYDDWVKALVHLQTMFDQDREFRNVGKFSSRNDYFQKRIQGSYKPKVAEPQYEPMDVDAVKHVKPKPVTTKPLRKKEEEPHRQNRLPPHPSSSRQKPLPQKPREPYRKRPLYCFICDQPGHFAKECKAKINEIKITHIQQLGLALEESMYSGSQEEDYDEEEQELEKWMGIEEEEDGDYDHQEDLITFTADDNSKEPDF
ncbi:hypothetical protein BDM02DRAFT_3193309 [Thelephora ganbajun]|uniref:Uncharacterized protein n=1 Tax=Thelephora ganbajun TaxID=370292 RepID=A0ACB6YYN9_THEGA|nr:hypothetical protein BDM02DRAFT_3193309 [Thelephora ganbajun]